MSVFPVPQSLLPTPKISIALCTFNGDKFLREQLESIASQTRLPDKLYVSDDGSSDDTIAIVRDFASSSAFPVVLSVNGHNLGSTKNFEQAMRRCGGDIVVLADQDDVWRPEKLELLERRFVEKPDSAVIFTNGSIVNRSLRPLGYTLRDVFRFNDEQVANFTGDRAFELLLHHNVATGATMAFRSALLDRFLPIPDEWIHDEWIAVLAAIMNCLDYYDRCLIDYRQHAGQQIGGLKKKMRQRIRDAWFRGADDYQKSAAGRYRSLLCRLTSVIPEAKDFHISGIRDKIAHLDARATLRTARGIARVSLITREIVSRRYFRYAAGFSSACKDLFPTCREDE